MQRAKIFKNGQSQAVRIPKEYRFNSKEVMVTPLGDGIILQPVLKSWEDVFNKIKPTNDFLTDRIDKLPETNKRFEMFK